MPSPICCSAGQHEALGSNNWVVDGTLTASGKPLLANDPHLAHARPVASGISRTCPAGDFEVIGATLPGTPAVAIGRNRYIAWGETNVAADVEDLYRERSTQPAARRVPRRAGADDGHPGNDRRSRAAVRSSSTCASRGTVRSSPTRINANNAAAKTPPAKPPPSSRSPFDGPRSTMRIRRSSRSCELNEARNWNEFTAALRDFVAPSQNFVYADVDGHIGYYAPGRIPIRA